MALNTETTWASLSRESPLSRSFPRNCLSVTSSMDQAIMCIRKTTMWRWTRLTRYKRWFKKIWINQRATLTFPWSTDRTQNSTPAASRTPQEMRRKTRLWPKSVYIQTQTSLARTTRQLTKTSDIPAVTLVVVPSYIGIQETQAVWGFLWQAGRA